MENDPLKTYAEFRVVTIGKYLEVVSDECYLLEKELIVHFCTAFDLPYKFDIYDKETGWFSLSVSCPTEGFYANDVEAALKTFMSLYNYGFMHFAMETQAYPENRGE